MRATSCYRVAFAGAELHLLLRILQEETETAFQYIKGIAYVVVGVPRNSLGRRQLKLANSEAGTLQVAGSTLYLVQMTSIFQRFLFLPRVHGRQILHCTEFF